MASSDRTPQICSEYGIKVVQTGKREISEIRNSLLGKEWNFYIHPWEVLATGHDEIKAIDTKKAYNIQIYKKSIISYEIRLWRGAIFKNPIYETIKCNSNDVLSKSIIHAKLSTYYFEDVLSKIREWDDETMSLEASYYKAFALLEKRKFQEFMVIAEHYLALDSQSLSAIMMRYYLAQVQIQIYGNASKSVRNTLICIATKPLMAEFWCLLGDIYYKQKIYKKARSFYETAITLGQQRLKLDLWPVEIVKYEKYPSQMIANIDQILTESKLFELSS